AVDVLKVLQRRPDRPFILEAKALRLAGKLLDLCLSDRKKKRKPASQTMANNGGEELAMHILDSGKAWAKMREIMKAQGGDPGITVDSITLGEFRSEIP